MPSSKSLPIQTDTTCKTSAFIKGLIHKCREGKSDPNLTLYERVRDAADALQQMGSHVPESLSYGCLALTEQAVRDAEFRYAVVQKEGKPVLFALFQVYTLTARSFNLHKERTIVKNILSLFLHIRRARVVLSGNALRTDTPAYCYDSSAMNAHEAMEAVAAIADRVLEQDDASAVILTPTTDLAPATLESLARMGYTEPMDDLVMDLTIRPQWNSLDTYVADLSRKYRARAQKILRSVEGIDVRDLSAQEALLYRHDLRRLFDEVVEKQPFTLSTSGADYIVALKQHYGDRFDIVCFLKDNRPVAFYSAFADDDSYELFYVGVDMAINTEHNLYFNLLFTGLQRAIDRGSKVLKLGRTSYDAKASLGARPRKQAHPVKLHHIPDVARNWFANYFSTLEDGHWKLRDPLKVQE